MHDFRHYDEVVHPAECQIAIVASRYNEFIVKRLLEGCTQSLLGAGVPAGNIAIVRVPGAFEIPVAAARLARAGKTDAVIALGAIIRGETTHFEFIAGECARGLARVAIDYEVPVIFGVLTAENAQQAMDRSGVAESNKGSESATAALQMIGVMHGLRP